MSTAVAVIGIILYLVAVGALIFKIETAELDREDKSKKPAPRKD